MQTGTKAIQKPDDEHDDQGEKEHEKQRVEAASVVGEEAREEAAKTADAVHHGNEVEARLERIALSAGVGGKDTQSAEEDDFDAEDRDGQEGERGVGEEVKGHHARLLLSHRWLFRRESTFDENIADDKEC